MTVTALLVSNDGARWLPAVIGGLQEQRRRPDRVVAVDTGSTDETPRLLREAFGDEAVLDHSGSFPEAVAHVLPRVDTEWVWLLHDDARPEPGALAALLEAARSHDADVVGPKLREWPSLRRLLELGVTISGTGARETGLERGEYDQGQHDEVREVLAVNTAGMLVRRTVLERLDGFDRALPLFGNDLDLGWRAARAGFRTVVAPDAVVFHAEAAHRGLRRTKVFGRRARTHRHEREAALYTLLANSPARRLPFLAVRLLVGSLLRVLGYLLARSPGLAGDEFAAVLGTYGRPRRILAARRARRALDSAAEPRDVRRLLAPWWVPYRHGLDLVSDLATAAGNQSRDAAERRRAARAEEAGQAVPAARRDDDELPAADSGWVVRFLTSPVALGTAVFLLLTLWGTRAAFGPTSGGGLSPAPDDVDRWWELLGEGWHQLGQGTDAPAPAYLVPLALVGTVLGGSATAAVTAVLVGSVPLAAWGAWRFGRVVAELGSGREANPWLVGWAATAYAVLPLASGAWGQGRLGVVASAALLPWLGHAALGLAEPSSERRWRAAWRSGLLLAVITAFTPAAWLVALLVVAGLLVAGAVLARDVARSGSVWGPLAITVAVPPVLLLPGTVGVLRHDVGALLLEAGRQMPLPGALDLAAGRFGDPAAPWWLGLLLVLPALAALARPRARLAVTACWVLVALAAVLASVLSRVTVDLPSGPARPGLGFLLVLGQGALLVAVLVAAHGLASSPRRASVRRPSGWRPSGWRPSQWRTSGWRPSEWRPSAWRPAAVAALAAAAVLAPAGGWLWWLVSDDGLLGEPSASEVPVYMAQRSASGAEHGVLVLRGSVEEGIGWEVRRDDGVTVGEDEILALTAPDPALDADVARLVARPDTATVVDLSGHGVDYVVMPAPVDRRVAATLDAASGLVQASAPDRATRAWQLERPAAADALTGDGPWWHPWLVALQVLAIVVVAVLAGPARREDR